MEMVHWHYNDSLGAGTSKMALDPYVILPLLSFILFEHSTSHIFVTDPDEVQSGNNNNI
jgi:hypothetical protein